MKRPLFWVCITLAVVAMLNAILCGMPNETAKLRQAYPEDPPWEEERIIFQGKVVEKGIQGDQEYFLLSDLSSNQEAAASRQIISILQTLKTNRIQCFLAAESGGALPKMGSKLFVEGHFSFYNTATNPGEFDFAKYYQGKRIGGKLTESRILWQSESYNRIREFLQNLKAYFGKRLDHVFSTRESGVMRTMLLGDRTQLDSELRELYQEGGIVHILSISGLHVTLLGMGLYSLLRRLGMRMGFASLIAGSTLVLYGIMTGMSVSACRAIGMFLLRMLALIAGRTYDLPTAVVVMACGMLCTEPVNMLNSGFWLSFGSIFGVGVTLPVLEKANDAWSEKKREAWKERPDDTWKERVMTRMAVLSEEVLRALRTGLAILLTTLPLSLWFYYEVPTYSALLNLIVVPLMGPVLLFGMLAMLIPGLGILGTIDVLGLRFFEKLCLGIRGLPFSFWNPGCPKPWQMMAYYVALGIGLGVLWKWSSEKVREVAVRENVDKNGKKGKIVPLRGWLMRLLVVLPILIFFIPARRITGVTFLDVGQGDCILIRLGNGQTWIYDCGSTSRKEVGDRVLIPYLKHEGIHHLDGIFVSHGDSDHVNGIKELFENAKMEGIKIERLYVPNWEDAAEKFSGLLQVAEQLPGIKIQYLAAGDVLSGKHVKFLVLHPPRAGNAGASEAGNAMHGAEDQARAESKANGAEDGNERSMCLEACLEWHGKNLTALLTGDVQGAGEETLLEELRARGIHEVTILKCAHHGSQYATSLEFLKQINARITVISCGRNNRYGHPHAQLLRRLASDDTTILRTDQSGAITILCHGDVSTDTFLNKEIY